MPPAIRNGLREQRAEMRVDAERRKVVVADRDEEELRRLAFRRDSPPIRGITPKMCENDVGAPLQVVERLERERYWNPPLSSPRVSAAIATS